MIISKLTATKLAKSGKATIEDCTTAMDGKTYRLVTRHDIQRMDHVSRSLLQPTLLPYPPAKCADDADRTDSSDLQREYDRTPGLFAGAAIFFNP